MISGRPSALNNPRWLGRWARLFSEYTAAQGAVQLLGVVSGLLIVNLLPVREYALYTFALSVFTFLAVFSDLGVNSALIYFRRETRIAGTAFAPYVAAAFRLRYVLLALGACAALVFMVLVGRERDFTTLELSAVGAVLVAAVWVQVGASIALLQLRLEGSYRESYWAEILGNGARLLAVAMMWASMAALASVAMIAGAFGSLVTSLFARRAVRRTEATATDGEAAYPGEPMKGIARYLVPMSVSAVYYSIQSPLIVWLSVLFAGTRSIAEVGALGRLGIIFGLVSGFMGVVLLPRLSAVSDEAIYLRRYFQCWLVLILFGVAVIALAYCAPGWFLLLLGDAYRDLERGVLLIAIGSVLSTLGGFAVGINNARGWVRHLPLAVAVFALAQASLILVLDLSTTTGVLYFGLWSAVAGLFLQLVLNLLGFFRPEWVKT